MQNHQQLTTETCENLATAAWAARGFVVCTDDALAINHNNVARVRQSVTLTAA